MLPNSKVCLTIFFPGHTLGIGTCRQILNCSVRVLIKGEGPACVNFIAHNAHVANSL